MADLSLVYRGAGGQVTRACFGAVRRCSAAFIFRPCVRQSAQLEKAELIISIALLYCSECIVCVYVRPPFGFYLGHSALSRLTARANPLHAYSRDSANNYGVGER